jgi:hypothetical protein
MGDDEATPDSEKVKSRAEGRPPEERSSDDPKSQAEAILEDSEARVAQGSAKSETSPDGRSG